MKCGVRDCSRDAEHRGWCSMHYQRWRIHGEPTVVITRSEARIGKARKHGQCINGKPSRTYRSWQQMRERCQNKRHVAWDTYGANGIAVCERWDKSFANFLADMGECPPGLTLERIDGTCNYEPENCKWATRLDQARNTARNVLTLDKARSIRMMRADGMTVREISKQMSVREPTIRGVLGGYTWRESK